ncbi:gamma-glutamyl-gamma-aminobutyrate hydrolase family protein [Imhoffiella purpurea]|uniref:Glutamine amidotransferase, class I n=1 Tax=Imhoffiella purpurea TaxID=1249627 RepID=W9VUD6_9GAMM|nr:gamma-glutamyl-gamma-aminobutyrate hydrolase family protein [Imhoffiella purpurea]EXJ13980.1 Glutamine amidotransferase, class I [Imhoffiella purpurea]
MAERPRIGITGNARRWAPAWWCARLAVRLAGGTAERISVRHPPSGRPLSGLIIGGGNDISPEHYDGDLLAKVKTDPERDDLEMDWIRRALKDGTPLLGICRGAQLINVVLGGTLHQDIRTMRKHTRNRPGLLPTKQVQLIPDARLAALCGTSRLRVNSLHHQAVRDPGKGIRIVGRDLDQLVQAFESDEGRPVMGVQWHPEYLFYLPSQRAIFRWLIERVG